MGKSIKDELSTPSDKANGDPAALATRKYGVGKMELFRASFSREFLLMKRNKLVYIFKLGQVSNKRIYVRHFVSWSNK